MVNVNDIPKEYLVKDMPELRGLVELTQCNPINAVYENETNDSVTSIGDTNKMVSAMITTRRNVCRTMFSRNTNNLISGCTDNIVSFLSAEFPELKDFFPNNDYRCGRLIILNAITCPCNSIGMCNIDEYASYLVTEYNIRELAACAANTIVCEIIKDTNIGITDKVWNKIVDTITDLYNIFGNVAWSYIKCMYPGMVSYNNSTVKPLNGINPISYNRSYSEPY